MNHDFITGNIHTTRPQAARRCRVDKLPSLAMSLVVLHSVAWAYQVPGSSPQLAPRLFSVVGVPQQALRIRAALPGMYDRLGHERRILTGTVTVHGASTPFTFTRELDQKVRLDLGNGPNQRAYIATGLHTLLTPANISAGAATDPADHALLEVLAEDSTDNFLFSFGTATQLHWLGGGYSEADGSQAGHTGPQYDIFSSIGNASTQPETPQRTKIFIFDSVTKLLRFTRYQMETGGSTVEIEDSYTNWTTLNGQLVPATIIRSENGQPSLTISITSASCTATQQDSLFGPGQ